MNYAIILAAGKSERFNKKNKNLIVVNKKPIYKQVVEIFVKTKLFKQVLLVVSAEDKAFYTNIHFNNVRVVLGNPHNRQLSLASALKTISPKPTDIIVTHDCARPFVKPQLIRESVKCCTKHGYSTTMIPLADSICLRKNNKFIYKDRNELFLVQTPQSFQYKFWKKTKDNNSTDLFTFLKLPITNENVVKGSVSNYKITYKEDC
ncbi:MAG: 2-C-methyl-D-erythritol 4-phosphate cytidylyltransferase [Mycoplasmataceae bacterium]|nr:2-C-methyl-D-erythritol 4-phosphate cytidylyltransferase [Mycoplasmataceae bacterium]